MTAHGPHDTRDQAPADEADRDTSPEPTDGGYCIWHGEDYSDGGCDGTCGYVEPDWTGAAS